jgi:hypothetical protein
MALFDQRGTVGEDYFSAESTARRDAEERASLAREQQGIADRENDRYESEMRAQVDEAETPYKGGAQGGPDAGAVGNDGKSGGSSGKKAATDSGNPYAIAIAAVQSYIQHNTRMGRERSDYKQGLWQSRANQYGAPSYAADATMLRKKQRRDTIGSPGYDPMKG